MPSSNGKSGSGQRLSGVVPVSERQQMALVMQMTNDAHPGDSDGGNSGVSERNERGETPLHVAAIRGDLQQVKTLLDQGADPNAPDFAGWRPLHEACNHGWLEVSLLLLERGALVNAKGLADDTPLHDAAVNGHIELVKLLLDQGADTSLKNRRGKTPYDVATPEARKLLRNPNESASSSSSGEGESEGTNKQDMRRLPPHGKEKCGSPRVTLRLHHLKEKKEKSKAAPPTIDHDSYENSGNMESGKGGADDVVTCKEGGDEAETGDGKENLGGEAGGTPQNTQETQEQETGQPQPQPPNVTKRTHSTEEEEDTRKKRRKDDASRGKSGSNSGGSPKSAVGGESENEDNKSVESPGPKVPPLKIVIPGASLEEQGTRNGKNGTARHHQALPYVVSSTEGSTTSSEGSPPPSQQQQQTTSHAQPSSSPPAQSNQSASNLSPSSASNQSANQQQQQCSQQPAPPSSHRSSPDPADQRHNNTPPPNPGGAQQSTTAQSSDSSTTERTHQRVLRSHRSGNGGNSSGASGNPSPVGAAEAVSPRQVSPTPGADAPAAADMAGGTAGSEEKVVAEEAQQQPQVSAAPGTTPHGTTPHNSTSVPGAGGPTPGAPPPPSQPNVELHPRKRKLKPKEQPPPQESHPEPPASQTAEQQVTNCYQLFLNIRKQIDKRRKGLFPVQPKPPQGFKDYLMNRCTYVLAGNTNSRVPPPHATPPPSINPNMRDIFISQEKERYRLRMQHVIEKEKLVLSVEQEILRVHGRAARALANQALPFSACTILRDEEVYSPFTPEQEEKDRNARSRYNGRLFLSWLQDVDDKWEKIKEAMLLRHHNEAESLHAVQRMDWEWKLKELGVCEFKAKPVIDDSHVPIVHVSDDFDLLPA